MRNLLLPPLILWLLPACGFSLYKELGDDKQDIESEIEAVKIHLDRAEYAEALEDISAVSETTAETEILKVAATLGVAGLSMWDLILEVIDNTANSTSTVADGENNVLNSFSDSIFGTDEERESRITALQTSRDILENSSVQTTQTENLLCFLSAISVLPLINDGTQAITAATQSLESMIANVTGAGNSAEECPGLNDFDKTVTELEKVELNLAKILTIATKCEILSTTGEVNEMSRMLNQYKTAADKGCPKLVCDNDACRALELGCVQNLLLSNQATAEDGKVDRCELIFNCLDAGSCF